jgi:type IV pilus assembly protein PilV
MHTVTAGCKAAGASLLEVLIASSVLSIGVLGMADLQIRSLQASQANLASDAAAVLADDLAARLRGNPLAAAQGLYSVAASVTTDCSETSCNAAALAAYDLATWSQQIAISLPSGTGWVRCGSDPCTAAAVQTIVVSWRDVTLTGTDPSCGTGQPGVRCFSLGVEP